MRIIYCRNISLLIHLQHWHGHNRTTNMKPGWLESKGCLSITLIQKKTKSFILLRTRKPLGIDDYISSIETLKANILPTYSCFLGFTRFVKLRKSIIGWESSKQLGILKAWGNSHKVSTTPGRRINTSLKEEFRTHSNIPICCWNISCPIFSAPGCTYFNYQFGLKQDKGIWWSWITKLIVAPNLAYNNGLQLPVAPSQTRTRVAWELTEHYHA